MITVEQCRKAALEDQEIFKAKIEELKEDLLVDPSNQKLRRHLAKYRKELFRVQEYLKILG